MSHSVSSDVLKAMRESYALTRELGLPNMTSEYWSNLLESGRQDYGGKGDFIADDELWASFRSNVITKGLDNANVPEEALERVQVKWRNIHRELTSVVPERLQHYFEETPVGGPRSVNHDGIPMTQSSYTQRFATHVDKLCRDMPNKAVAEMERLHHGTVKALDTLYMQEQVDRAGLPAPRAIGVDGISIRKGHNYRVIVSDLERARPIWVGGEGRKETDIDLFFKALGGKKSARIKLAPMGMWKPFRNSVIQQRA